MPDPSDPEGDAGYRLPRTVLPRRYELTIEPDLDSATFTGRESVEVDIVEAVDAVVLHAAELDVEEAWLEGPDGQRVDPKCMLDDVTERLTLEPGVTLDPGRWTVHLGFTGVLNDKLKGFYRSTFTDDAGHERVIGTTQMEPADARRAFPCWDEPDLKAVFAITLVVAEGLLAVSNAAAVEETPAGDGRVAVRFADTIPMSTYLVAFVVGPLEATDAVDVDGIPLRVIHVPGKGHLTPYALEVGAFCLRWFADYYGIPYPGDKVDFVALPDFAAGAMENLGCITYREAVLLVDPDEATQVEQQRVADVIAHELAHMWFGDLVTMRWWNGLWLNEAFATFMELAAVDAFRPEWHRWVDFTTERSAAFAVDALASTRPIEYPVRSPEDAEGMFDVLTYQKGASVLRMLEQYLGTDRFREGIRLYLRAREYGNAETTDLWDAIEEATGDPVRRIMDAWIFQGGFPVVSVDRDGDHDGDGDVLVLDQRRFRYLDDPDGEGVTWPVPLLVRSGGTRHSRLLDDATGHEPVGAGPAVVNAGGHGFYRVRYAPALLAELAERPFDLLEPVERALLVDDTWASVVAGHTSASELLDLLAGLTEETDRTVWSTIAAVLTALDRLVDDAGRPGFQAFVRQVVGPTLERLGWEPRPDDSELTRQLRGTVITTLGVVGADPSVRGRARETLDANGTGHQVDPNVAAAAIAVVAVSGDADDHRRYVDRFRGSSSPQEALRFLYALGTFPGPDEAQRTLTMSLSDDVRSQNAPFLLLHLLHNRHVNELAWEFVKGEWDRITTRLPDSGIPRLLGGITSLATPELAADVERFLADHPVPQGAKTVEQHLERLRVNVALRQREANVRWERLL